MEHFAKSGYIAFFDILGFKNLVHSNELNKVTSIYFILFESVMRQLSVQLLSKDELTSQYFQIETQSNPIKSIIVSDNVVLWVEDLSIRSFVMLSTTIESMLQLGFSCGLPLRGAISSGSFSVMKLNDNVSIIGKPLIEAFSSEANQNWAGCVLNNSAFEQLKYSCVNSEQEWKIALSHFHNLIRYDVPSKLDNINQYVINWTNAIDNIERVEKSFESFRSSNNNSKTLEVVNNTKTFYKYAKGISQNKKDELLNEIFDKNFFNLIILARQKNEEENNPN